MDMHGIDAWITPGALQLLCHRDLLQSPWPALATLEDSLKVETRVRCLSQFLLRDLMRLEASRFTVALFQGTHISRTRCSRITGVGKRLLGSCLLRAMTLVEGPMGCVAGQLPWTHAGLPTLSLPAAL
eukprot:3407043-Amphidinium_carterae.1